MIQLSRPRLLLWLLDSKRDRSMSNKKWKRKRVGVSQRPKSFVMGWFLSIDQFTVSGTSRRSATDLLHERACRSLANFPPSRQTERQEEKWHQCETQTWYGRSTIPYDIQVFVISVSTAHFFFMAHIGGLFKKKWRTVTKRILVLFRREKQSRFHLPNRIHNK